jgi:PhnB protein
LQNAGSRKGFSQRTAKSFAFLSVLCMNGIYPGRLIFHTKHLPDGIKFVYSLLQQQNTVIKNNTMNAVNPCLYFSGNCDEAFNFYKSVFDGEFASHVLYKEMPAGPPVSENDAARILHVALPIGRGTVLMGSDKPESMGASKVGDNFSISISADTKDEVTRLFNGLSAGGQVNMPLTKTFWSEWFGMFIDKYGVHWMVGVDAGRVE